MRPYQPTNRTVQAFHASSRSGLIAAGFSRANSRRRIIENESSDAVQRIVIANDLFVIISLSREISSRRGAIYRARIHRGRTENIRGRNELRPYNYNAVNVVGHDGKRILAAGSTGDDVFQDRIS